MPGKGFYLYVIFIIVFLLMHFTGIIAGDLPYIYNAIITFSVTFLSLLVLDKLYSGRSFKQVISDLGFRSTHFQNIVPGILIFFFLLFTYPLLALLLDAELVLHEEWLMNLVGVCLTGGLAEEIFFRGFLFRHLREKMTFSRAALISMTLFTIAHLMMFVYMPWPVALLSTILAITMSIPLGYLFERGNNSVWSPAIVHATARTIGLVITTTEHKFMNMSLYWLVTCMIVPWLVLLIYKNFRMIL